MVKNYYSVIWKGKVLSQCDSFSEAVSRAKLESCVGDVHGNTVRPVSVWSGPLSPRHPQHPDHLSGVTKHVCYEGGKAV